jgi:RNA-directed DNA polymerase
LRRLELPTVDLEELWKQWEKEQSKLLPLQRCVRIADLATLITVPGGLLDRLAFKENLSSYYGLQYHKKRNGDIRVISAPNWRIKYIQKRIKPFLEELYRPSSRAHGYISGRGIKSNAESHAGKRFILNVDLENFFGTITRKRIRGRLMAAPYNLSNEVASAISRLCTVDGVLPLGAPTSPVLSNIMCSKLDFDLTNLGRELGCFYTRYSDDITFSTNKSRFPSDLVILPQFQRSGRASAGSALTEIFDANGFVLNPAKTFVASPSDSKRVTGIVCNKELNPLRKLRRDIRGAIHAWQKFGREGAETVFNEKYNWRSARSLEDSLRGKIEFLKFVKGAGHPSVVATVTRFNGLPGRELKDIKCEINLPWQDALPLSVVVIESITGQLDIYQGTAFKVSESRFLTNAHNVMINGEIIPDISIRRGDVPIMTYPVKVVKIDHSKDIALLEFDDVKADSVISGPPLEIVDREVSFSETVVVVGFPNYQSSDSVHVMPALVTGKTSPHGVEMFRVNVPIIKGSSGGPVFGTDGKVAGMTARGVEADDLRGIYSNGIISARELVAFLQD